MAYLGYRQRSYWFEDRGSPRFRALAPTLGARTLLWAVGAVLAAAALAAIAAQADDPQLDSASRTDASALSAPATVDPAQVRRGQAEARLAYDDGGFPAVLALANSCPNRLAADQTKLDLCLTLLREAARLAQNSDLPEARAWAQDVAADQLALVRRVVAPGQDPAARLTAVERIARGDGSP